MYQYLKKMMEVSESIGEITDFFFGDYGDEKAIFLDGATPDGKNFHLKLTFGKRGVKDGT